MEPRTLIRENFQSYPPLAQKLAIQHLELLRDLPLVLAAVLLREVVDFDARFPRERSVIETRFTFLERLPVPERRRLTKGFAELSLPSSLVAEDWVHYPQRFEEDLSAHLWASKQYDTFHLVATEFNDELAKATPPDQQEAPRWTVVVLPSELRHDAYPVFRKLRPHGVFYPKVEPDGGIATILDELSARASRTRIPYGHWYVEGGTLAKDVPDAVSSFSWEGSSDLRAAVLAKAQQVIESGNGGPEMLRSIMANWALGVSKTQSADSLVEQFVMSIYGEGSGTQIYSTTFVQWAAREILRRAEPVSLVARFGPRNKQRTMNEMFSKSSTDISLDIAGSLIDADLGAYYTWINLNRLSHVETSSFVAWSEALRQAVAIGPGCPQGTEAPNSIPLNQLLHA